MNVTLLDTTIATYRDSLETLDAHAKKRLSGTTLREYMANRERFEQQLKAWQKTHGSELAIFSKNLEEGYHELEAKVV